MNLAQLILEKILVVFFKLFFSVRGRADNTPLLEKTALLYKGSGFTEIFTHIRLWDSPIPEIEKLVPHEGVIIDLGCGDGLLTNYLALSSPKRKVYGIELNQKRIKQADKGLKNTKFIAADITEKQIPKADTILLVHVLHHLTSLKDQEALLQTCYENLSPKGELVISEINTRPLVKYWFTWITDTIIVPILFENRLFNGAIFFRSTNQWKNLLKSIGFKCRSYEAHKDKPFSHSIIICQKI